MRRASKRWVRRSTTFPVKEFDMIDQMALGQPVLGWHINKAGQKVFETLGHEEHVVTIAPTGAGKGTCVLIPALLRYPGQCIVIDSKGEAARLTAGRRRAMGQTVHVLDPFSSTQEPLCRLNPFDLLRDLEHPSEHVSMLLDVLVDVSRSGDRDPFWGEAAKALLEALLIHQLETLPREQWNIAHFVCMFPRDNPRTHAMLHEMEESAHALVRAQVPVINGLLVSHITARDIVAHASTLIAPLCGNVIAYATNATDLELDAVRRGDPMTVYLVIPPNQLDTARPLLRTWLMTLSATLLKRKVRPELSTLLLIDEAAQLGRMELMLQAMTLLRGYGLQCWSFWQDLSQMQGLYPESWRTILANASAIQIFGFPTTDAYLSAPELIKPDEATDVSIALAKRCDEVLQRQLTPYFMMN